jgi:DNA-binding NtrC family response regulator
MNLRRVMAKRPEAGSSILLVDSRPTGLRLMQGLLGKHVDVTWTPGPDEALEQLGRRRFDGLVASAELIDLRADGFLAKVGALCAGVGRVLVGPDEHADDILQALREGWATGFVLEPFTPDELLVAVRRVLRSEPPRALLVLRDRQSRLRLKATLERSGVECWEAESPAEVMPRLEAHALDGVIVGLDLGAGEALTLLAHMRSNYPKVRSVVVGENDLPALAADLRRLGVYDYLSSGASDREAEFRIRCALEDRPWADQVDGVGVETADADQMVGSSRPMEALRALVATVAQSVAPVLIRGETGSGKDLVARRIHALSQRREGPFFAINCAALNDTLFESEMFGHERGAFTGAATQKPGLCELANEGTLFLDEVAELSPAAQAKLLRFLQSGEFIRLGGRAVLTSKARVVAATNRPLESMIERGEFRADLFHRLNVLEVSVPSLRERMEDLPELGAHLLARLCQEHGRPSTRLLPRAFERLLSYNWPGNVRELESVLERALLLASGPVIQDVRLRSGTTGVNQAFSAGPNVDQPLREAVDAATRQVEREYLVRVLTLVRGNVIQASQRSGIDRRNFYRKLAEHGLEPAQFRNTTGTFPSVG